MPEDNLIHFCIARADVPNKNGRTYPRHVLEGLAALPLAVPVIERSLQTDEGPVTLAQHAGEATLRLVDDELIAEVRLNDKAFFKLIECGYKGAFSMTGTGNVVHGVVVEYALESIDLNWDLVSRHSRLRSLLRRKLRHYATRRPEENR